jgi:hypothetical protein
MISAGVVVEGVVEGEFERTVRGVVGVVAEAVRIQTKTSMWALQPRIVRTNPVALYRCRYMLHASLITMSADSAARTAGMFRGRDFGREFASLTLDSAQATEWCTPALAVASHLVVARTKHGVEIPNARVTLLTSFPVTNRVLTPALASPVLFEVFFLLFFLYLLFFRGFFQGFFSL